MGNRAILYLRLSKEDLDKINVGDDSNSIKNQRLLLMDYAIEHDFEVVGVYSDDDESGLYDTRPDFERLIEDGKIGKFDVVIAKSQSRFTRNMEHLEKYLHHDFLLLGIRFIGVVDHTDTAIKGNKKARQINGLVNEWYCEDLSNNIRSVFKIKMKEGQFIASSTPYGYLKDPKNHNHLIIDPYASAVVKHIFELYLQGYGKGRIGNVLSNEGILRPSEYKRLVLGQNYYNPNEKATSIWSYQTVHQILNNEVYIGNMVQNKCCKISYKSKVKKALPKDEWITVSNTHEPIILYEIYDKVQKMQGRRTREVITTGKQDMFSFVLYCGDCHKSMERYHSGYKEKRFTGYTCKTYKRHGVRHCSMHKINAPDLERAVLESIKKETREILKPKDIQELRKFRVLNDTNLSQETSLTKVTNEIVSLEKHKKQLYEDYLEGILDKNDYINYKNDFAERITKLEHQKDQIKKEIDKKDVFEEQYDEWVEAFKDYINISELTRDIINELIEKIEVFEGGRIKIHYKFQNPFYAEDKGFSEEKMVSHS